WYRPRGEMIGQQESLEGLTCPEDGLPVSLRQQLCTIAREAVRQNLSVFAAFPDSTDGAAAVSVSHTEGCLVAVGPAGDALWKMALELTAEKSAGWLLQREAQSSARNAQHVAAMVELVGHLTSADTVAESAERLAVELRRYLGAEDVGVALSDSAGLQCRLVATAQRIPIDRQSETTRSLEAALQESLSRRSSAVWPAADATNRHALLAHQAAAEATLSAAVVSCPLITETGQNTGAVLVCWGSGIEDIAEKSRTAERFLTASMPVTAAVLAAQRKTSAGLRQRFRQTLRRADANRMRAISAVAAVCVGILLLPIDYRVTCDSELQPLSRRFVAAPFEAPLQSSFVEPGDVVEADQLLARLDGRELRWELAGITADLAKATKEHNTFLSEQEFGDAAIARHEMERLENRAALLAGREHQLEVRSPVAGVVVSGDLKGSEGVPLTTGQSLFEIAPLDRMLIEVAVPEDDIRHVRPGMSVRVQWDALPEQILQADIVRVHPRSELRDHESVFIAEAEIDNAAEVLRPGMKGSAKISTGRRMLGWNLFHKPVAWIIGRMGW
ncbi:MAG: HlyD family efflux transporter periplasmic adaptor subunit, partial [Planctomycetaceae bacterium]|nr:HlyD family efflux transporter periplasmic adaptor subunit [Planctomycetaceae bacterium]